MDISTLFFDVGGVVLTNGWDRHQRRAAVEHFGLDWEEFADRHELIAAQFETGALTLDDYLDRTVFYRNRHFARERFVAFMQSRSQAIPGTFDVLTDLAAGPYFLATLNNESAELNRYRITNFGLRDYFQVFFSSASLGVRKPDREIYDMALSITQREPAECVFVDDRELNLHCASLQGMRTILFRNPEQLRADLAALGVTV